MTPDHRSSCTCGHPIVRPKRALQLQMLLANYVAFCRQIYMRVIKNDTREGLPPASKQARSPRRSRIRVFRLSSTSYETPTGTSISQSSLHSAKLGPRTLPRKLCGPRLFLGPRSGSKTISVRGTAFATSSVLISLILTLMNERYGCQAPLLATSHLAKSSPCPRFFYH